ncbi:hypothetical protein [Thermoflavimicrobium daqui]|jgi:hypothetical protein|uniref:Uncharacterized protein n=1 Tax=Thermoflavimicrobium daqui TaxID=2137476 RepID=A0A364K8T6_9BACL|nr:hypothetical protein [Thermoflavimicrobium daqui]RAL26716.1 hypothetical protein DL897_01300 [Thermoflavimicrobium daqui]
MWNQFIQFTVNDHHQFVRLQQFVKDFQAARELGNDTTVDDPKWLNYFDQSAIKRFWWPTDEEVKQVNQLLKSLPSEERRAHPTLQNPWDFASWLDALYHAEHKLLNVELEDDIHGRLTFETWSWPYGNVDALRWHVEIFGFTITKEDI